MSLASPTESKRYIGIDPTDRYARHPRLNDICIVELSNGRLVARFDSWAWPSDPLDVQSLLVKITDARAVLIDGPQGLASSGQPMRACERALGAPGKTSSERQTLNGPFGGFIRSSLDVFLGLRNAGLRIGSPAMLGLQEVYPGAIWSRLASALFRKTTQKGRSQRAAILRELGLELPDGSASHDQLDACISAAIGAAADGLIPGIKVEAVGTPISWDEGNKCLREGLILVPVVDAELRGRLEAVVLKASSPVRKLSDAGSQPERP